MSYPYNDEIQLQFMDNLRENMTNDIFQTIVASIDEIIDLKLDDKYHNDILPKIDNKLKNIILNKSNKNDT